MSVAQPVGPCAADGCGARFEPGDYWVYHSRLNAYVHSICSTTRTVKGEDIQGHTITCGQIPEENEE